MDINLKELCAAGEVMEFDSQAVSEVKLTVPPNLPDIEKVLYAAGRARLLSSEAVHDRVLMDGTVVYTVCYLSVDKTVEAWSASASFKTAVDAPGVTPESIINAWAQTGDAECVPGGGREVYIRSSIDIKVISLTNTTISILDAGDPSLITKACERDINCFREVKSRMVPLREDVTLKAPVSDIVSVSGYPVVSGIVFDDASCAVSGDINVCVVCKTGDDLLPVRMFDMSFPFAQLIPLENSGEGDMGRVWASLDELNAAIVEGEESLITVSGVLNLKLIVSRRETAPLTQDAYSVKTRVEVGRQELRTTRDSFNLIATKDFNGECAIEGVPNANSVVLASPCVLWTKCGEDEIEVEGVIDAAALYNDGTAPDCKKCELPFALTIDAPGVSENAFACVKCGARKCSGELLNGRLRLSATLDFDIQAFIPETLDVAVSAADAGERAARQPGIYICFVEEDCDMFDVAKRYLTTQERIAALNPDVTQLHPGQRLLIKV